MKKIVVLYGGLEERIRTIKIIREIFSNKINNVKTHFDDGEREFEFDELSYFAGIVNYAMQRNPEVIILHDIKKEKTVEDLREIFQCEIYTIYVGSRVSEKHDVSISNEDVENQVKEVFQKLI